MDPVKISEITSFREIVENAWLDVVRNLRECRHNVLLFQVLALNN